MRLDPVELPRCHGPGFAQREPLVGRGGLEPRTSAVTSPERCASRVDTPSVRRGVMWSGEHSSSGLTGWSRMNQQCVSRLRKQNVGMSHDHLHFPYRIHDRLSRFVFNEITSRQLKGPGGRSRDLDRFS